MELRALCCITFLFKGNYIFRIVQVNKIQQMDREHISKYYVWLNIEYAETVKPSSIFLTKSRGHQYFTCRI